MDDLEKSVSLASRKLVKFILNDEDMKKMTQTGVRMALERARCVISTCFDSVTLGNLFQIAAVEEANADVQSVQEYQEES